MAGSCCVPAERGITDAEIYLPEPTPRAPGARVISGVRTSAARDGLIIDL